MDATAAKFIKYVVIGSVLLIALYAYERKPAREFLREYVRQVGFGLILAAIIVLVDESP